VSDAVRIRRTGRHEGEIMSEEDKIQKIIDGLPPGWRNPGFDPHRGIERFRAATGELPDSADELERWMRDWVARNMLSIPNAMLFELLGQRNIRVVVGPALSEEPLDKIVEALRVHRERSPHTAPLNRRDVLEAARLAWGDSPDRWPQWAHDAYWAATD
jgi:hypothetical protein